jgi:hypothetical protein
VIVYKCYDRCLVEEPDLDGSTWCGCEPLLRSSIPEKSAVVEVAIDGLSIPRGGEANFLETGMAQAVSGSM